MQLKLLNFYKVISKFASYIVEAFMALIIYQITYSFTWALLYMVAFNILKVLFARLVYVPITKKPQLFLLLRIIPFLTYVMSMFLFDTDLKVLGIILVLIFQSISCSTGEIATDLIFNYSSLGKGTYATGVTRVFEYGGIILAILLGGLFLDRLDRQIVIIISMTSYLISVIPLFSYYLAQRKIVGFNEEATSNAIERYEGIAIKKRQRELVSKSLIRRYFFVYLAFCFADALLPVFSLYLFKESAESYSLVSYVQVAFYLFLSIGSYVTGKLDEKYDLIHLISISCIIGGIAVCIVPFVIHYIVGEIVLFAILGFCVSVINVFCFSRMIVRCRIMRVSNEFVKNRNQSSHSAQAIAYAFCSINPVMFIPTFFLIGLMTLLSAYFIPRDEKKTCKMLVDYLQNNNMY